SNVTQELKDIKISVNTLESNVTQELKDIKISVKNLESDVTEIKSTINNWVYADIARLEKRIEALERKAI
ncbi:MAG: hypothetical protein CVU88_05395, partial [Firmicutes bacterium HGW-Firmicutes-13]